MNVIGVDPGLANIGLALVSESGELLSKSTVKLGRDLDPDKRLRAAKVGLIDFAAAAYWPMVVLETYACYGLKGSIVNAFQMGRLIQCLLDVCDQVLGVPCAFVTAQDARRFVTGNPNARSPQIREGLRLMGYNGRMNDHERDALALALCWLDRYRREVGG